MASELSCLVWGKSPHTYNENWVQTQGQPGACNQRPWDLDPPTSNPALTPGPPGPQPHSPVGRHQLWDPWTLQPEIPGPDSACWWAGTGPRTWFHPPVGGHQPQDHRSSATGLVRTQLTHQPQGSLGPICAHQQAKPALRHLAPLSQPLQFPAPLTSGPSPALGHPGTCSQPCQELTLTASRLTIDLGAPAPQLLTLEPHSAHQWASSSPGTPSPRLPPPAACAPAPGTMAGNLRTRRAWQPSGPGGSRAYQTTHIVNPPQQKDPRSPHGHRGTPRAHNSGAQRGVCCWEA